MYGYVWFAWFRRWWLCVVGGFNGSWYAEHRVLTVFTIKAMTGLKELAALVYVCYQYAENLGWDLDEALNRVHRSNMSKLGEDGNPLRREDGKVLKGPN